MLAFLFSLSDIKIMLKPSAFTLTGVLLAGAVLLSGCSTTSYTERMAEKAAYHSDESYALNVMRQMYPTQLKDAPNPGDLEASSTLGTDVTLSTLTYLSGPRTFGGSFGLDLGFSLLAELGKETPPDLKPHLFAFVPVSEAPTRIEADKLLMTKIIDSIEKRAKELGFETIRWYNRPAEFHFLWQDGLLHGITLIKEDIGCFRSPNPKEIADGCGISLWIPEIKESEYPAVPNPSWLDAKQTVSWRYPGPAEFKFVLDGSAKETVDARKVMTDLAPGLPDLTFVYVPPEKVSAKEWKLPFLLSNKGVHLFVAPEGSTTAAEKDGKAKH